MIDETWGDPNPIQTKIEREFSSGPLFRGLAIPVTRSVTVSVYDEQSLMRSLISQPCPVSKHRMEVDDLNREYQTQTIHVDKRTHRIRYENETENEVTLIVEPK